MGNFVPVFIAFLLNCYGINVFREARDRGCGPLLSYLIFLFATFILLWDMRLYPVSLRKIWRCGDCFLQFVMAQFIMEHIMADFWLPLEAAVVALLPAVAEYVEETTAVALFSEDMLRCDTYGFFASYFLSSFFLVAVLHATRAIDLRLLECGIGVFFKEIITRIKRGLRRLLSRCGKRRKLEVCDVSGIVLDPYGNIISGELNCPGSPTSGNQCEDQIENSTTHSHREEFDTDDFSDYECEPPMQSASPKKRRR